MAEKLDCEVNGCTWARPDSATLELAFKLLEVHNKVKHGELFVGQVSDSQVARARPESLPRPSISEGATEADFARFEDKWARYRRSALARATPQHIQDQLWACCSDELEVSVYNSGASTSTEEKELMDTIRKLAVRRQNSLVNTTQFLDMAQDNEETAGSFTARLKGQASTCSFSLPCPSSTCSQLVSYRDQMVAHQLVRGLGDPVIQEQVLAQGAESGAAMDLTKILKFIEAKEAGKRSSLLLTSAGGLNKMSEYKRGKLSSSPSSSPFSPNTPSPALCKNCGSDKCKSRKDCFAKDKICSWCQWKGHFERVCLKKKKGEPKKESTNAHLSSLEVGTGSFCNLSLGTSENFQKRTIGHHEFDAVHSCWVARRAEPHPKVAVSVSVSGEAYSLLHSSCTSTPAPPPCQTQVHS